MVRRYGLEREVQDNREEIREGQAMHTGFDGEDKVFDSTVASIRADGEFSEFMSTTMLLYTRQMERLTIFVVLFRIPCELLLTFT